MTYLYKIDQHPDSRMFTVHKYEIISSTEKYYQISPRDIPNKKAMKEKLEVKKPHAIFYPGLSEGYFYSPTEAKEYYISRQEKRIAAAEKEMQTAKNNIEQIKKDILL